jgi:hypothetical protein
MHSVIVALVSHAKLGVANAGGKPAAEEEVLILQHNFI